MKEVYTELTFERVAKYLQCRGIYLVKEMCSKKHNLIMFNDTYNYEGDLMHFYMIRFLNGAQTRGPQTIAFSEVVCCEDQGYLIKKFNCNDIIEFAHEFEQLECGLSPLESFEDFSYLHEEECQLPTSLEDNPELALAWQTELLSKSEDIFEREYRTDLSTTPTYASESLDD